MTLGADGRRAEIADNLSRVRGRIAAACSAAGRRPEDVTLIAVTKTYPASDVLHLAALGVGDVGENRDQEASAKAAEIAAAGVAATWHYIGQLQRNKCRSVASYAAVVHSVDRLPLVAALASAREVASGESGVPDLDVLVQVNLDGRPDRGGAAPADVAAIADAVARARSLRLAGVMAVAPLGAVGAESAAAFDAVAEVSARLQLTYPEATAVSAGMSADFELAIAHGATHVRIGSLLLGARPPLG